MAIFKFENIRIAGMAAVVPKNTVKTESFKKTFGDEEVDKFMLMTGITETRRTTEFQTASDLAYVAASNLLKQLNISPEEIGALVFGTTSPDYRRPASAFVIQKRLGLSVETAVFDISLGCSSMIYGFQVVASMMNNSDIKKAILVLGDTASKTTHPEDRASIMIVGDTGVAVLLEKTEEPVPVTSLVRSDGNGYRYLIVPGGGYRNLNASREAELCADGNKRSLHHSFMQGTSVFTFTISDVPRLVRDYLTLTNTTVEDYDVFAFHQANMYILKQIAKKLKIPLERMPISIDRFGNTSGASPILTLCDAFGNSTEREINTMLCGFGVGLSWGVTSMKINTAGIFPVMEDDTVFEEGIIKSVSEL
ncbi:MAG: ketoacyl-ACP synthase III [Prolixibacteraceae bacterium]|jgi:3-oxoacyl-[acyl-carrier-protein] synthase-3|nr:ketoacyl-ACP synthase III [Prolixibacteraceae bacterium]